MQSSSFSKPPVWMTGLMMARSISCSSFRTWHMLRLPRGRKPRNPEVNFLPDWPGHFFDPSSLPPPASAARDVAFALSPSKYCAHATPTNTTKHHAIKQRVASQSVVAVHTSCNLSSCVESRNGLGIRTQHCWILSISTPPMQHWIGLRSNSHILGKCCARVVELHDSASSVMLAMPSNFHQKPPC